MTCRQWPLNMFPESPAFWPLGMWPVCLVLAAGGQLYLAIFNDVNIISIVPLTADIHSIFDDNDINLLSILPTGVDAKTYLGLDLQIVGDIVYLPINVVSLIFDIIEIESSEVLMGDFKIHVPTTIDIVTTQSLLTDILKTYATTMDLQGSLPIPGVIN